MLRSGCNLAPIEAARQCEALFAGVAAYCSKGVAGSASQRRVSLDVRMLFRYPYSRHGFVFTI